MQQLQLEDETWPLTVDQDNSKTLTTCLDSDLIVVRYDPEQSSELWSEELVTLVCRPFLPPCVAAELNGDTLLSKSILQDFFLGQLACAAMLKAIDEKRRTYPRMHYKGCEYENDAELLRQILQNEENQQTARLKYALVVRIEEKTVLDLLRREVLGVLVELNDVEAASDGDSRKRRRNE